uniref:Reverse transcriptase domain-containing protein n=1 Tax=Syphacia muris TaxID=451379 RepID=A0A0N5A8S1_9BILA
MTFTHAARVRLLAWEDVFHVIPSSPFVNIIYSYLEVTATTVMIGVRRLRSNANNSAKFTAMFLSRRKTEVRNTSNVDRTYQVGRNSNISSSDSSRGSHSNCICHRGRFNHVNYISCGNRSSHPNQPSNTNHIDYGSSAVFNPTNVNSVMNRKIDEAMSLVSGYIKNAFFDEIMALRTKMATLQARAEQLSAENMVLNEQIALDIQRRAANMQFLDASQQNSKRLYMVAEKTGEGYSLQIVQHLA